MNAIGSSGRALTAAFNASSTFLDKSCFSMYSWIVLIVSCARGSDAASVGAVDADDDADDADVVDAARRPRARARWRTHRLGSHRARALDDDAAAPVATRAAAAAAARMGLAASG